MSYQRVLPRDLFNEAKLLKCLGQLCLLIHDELLPLTFDLAAPNVGFVIDQDKSSGDIYCRNLRINSRANGVRIDVLASLNSREPYPLIARVGDEEVTVFTDNGKPTAEFLAAIQPPEEA